MRGQNGMHLEIPARSENESFARVVVGAFMARMNPTLEELSDVKTAVSEAVTNAIVHGYVNGVGTIEINASIEDQVFAVEVMDRGRGIEDIHQAMEPFYTSQPEQERSGMGFTVMQTFMDELDVQSEPGRGTTVRMRKRVKPVTEPEEK